VGEAKQQGPGFVPGGVAGSYIPIQKACAFGFDDKVQPGHQGR